jgi:hypothetical protein
MARVRRAHAGLKGLLDGETIQAAASQRFAIVESAGWFRRRNHRKASKFLYADSPDSADSSINPAKTPRYGKSTLVYRKYFIHRMLMIRVRARPLRIRESL